MAQNAFNLTAQINLQGPSNLRTIVADIRRQIGTVRVDINPTINASAQRSISDLNRAFRDLNTTLAITEANARTTATALQNLGQAVNNIGARNLQQNINNAANATQTLTRQAQNAANATNQAATGMEQFGRQSALAIRRFAAFSIVTSAVTGLVSAIRSGTSAFIDFDKEFVRLRQVSDSGVSSLNLLSKSITELSINLGVSSKELTTASVTLAQAGLSIRETEQALKALAKSALAPSFDNLNDTVEGSIALMRQFGISSNQLESALGSVNAVAAAFAVEASDLISAIQRTGGVFAASSKGVSEGTDALNEFLAIFTSIRQTTRESAETIATGLRTIFTRIQRGSTIEALKEYGVVLTDLENKFVGPFEAIKRLSEGLSLLDTRDIRFAKIVEELGGIRQIGKVIPAIQQFAVAQQALKVAQKGSDSLAKDSAIAQLALANQISKVREEFLALIRSIGQSESFRSFISLALDLTSGLIKLADAAKTVLPALTALAAIRGVSALTQFGAGFAGAFSAAGGARGLGQRLGGGRRFASGGLVPGSGNQDSIDAKLAPGEFVLRKSVVKDMGVGTLRKLNSGGYAKKFRGGGIANAPMVDDILQATGTILPRSSAIRALIKAGGGAIDIDRTIKRTIGDKAYGSAKTESQRSAALQKYFRDPLRRLQDVKTAPLTSFGKELKDAIQSGQLNPRRLSIISKSQRVPGVAEYLSQLFGIPTANMIFTQGASKEPALRAFRAKGPRIDRISRKYAMGGFTKALRSTKGISKGARSKFKELTPEEISKLSTADMIKYAKAQARDVFSTGGAGMATSSKFIPVPQERIIPELEGELISYRGQRGFWQEQISPFARARPTSTKAKNKLSREKALARQQARLSDEVAARAQEWTAIKQGSSIDNYLLSSLREPVLSDYKTVRGGGSLAKAFHNTRLRQSVNKVLDTFDDFDYSSGNIDKFVSAFAAKKFASGGLVQKFAVGTGYGGVKLPRTEQEQQQRSKKASYLKEVRQRGREVGYNRLFGLAGLQTGLAGKENVSKDFIIPQITPITKTPVKIQTGTIQKQYKDTIRQNLEDDLFAGYSKGVTLSAKKLAKQANITITTAPAKANDIIRDGGFSSVVGNGLEAVVGVVSDQFIKKNEKTKSLDFPFGLKQAGALFGIPGNIPADVTRTIGGFGKPVTQMLDQIERFLAAESRGDIAALTSVTAASGMAARLKEKIKDPKKREQANEILYRAGLGQITRKGRIAPNLEKELAKRPQAIQELEALNSGGKTQTASALLTPGEAVIDPAMAKSIGYAKLKKMNYADKYASGGGVSIVPGSGNGDTFGPIPLPVGSFVLRKKATQALGLNRGGIVGRYAAGGNVESTGGFNFSDLFSNFGVLSGIVLSLGAGLLSLRNNFSTVSSTVQRFTQNLTGANRVGFPRTGTGTARPGGPRAGTRNFGNQGSAIPAGGGFGPAAGFIALTAGGVAVEGAAGLLGGEKTFAGRATSAIGGDVLNYGAIGATIGGFLGPFGAAVGAATGAAAGLVTGLYKTAKATDEYNKQLDELSVETERNRQAQLEAENQKKLAEEQKRTQEAFKKLQEVSISLADAYNLSSARLERFGADLDNLSAGVSGVLSDLSGQARLQKTSRRDEQILSNTSGYSLREVRDVGSRVAGLVGGQQGRDLGQAVTAQKIIQEQLPALIRASRGGQPQQIISETRGLLQSQLGEQLTGPVNQILAEAEQLLIRERIVSREGENAEEIANEIGKLFGPIAEASQKVAQNLTTQFNDAIDTTVELLNQQIEALERSTEYTLRASDIRLRSEIELKQALGRTLSLQELNAPFQANITGLTRGVVRGGSSDPNIISNGIDRLIEENKKIESRIAQLKGSLGVAGGPSYQAGLAAIEDQQKALARNKAAINNGTKALQELANSGEAAQNALGKIQAQQQRSQAFGGLIRDLATSGPEQVLEFNRQFQAFQAGELALSQGRGGEVFGDLRFRQDFFAGLERFREVLDPERYARLLEQSTISVLETQQPGITRQRIGQGPETVADFIRRASGQVRQDDPALMAFKEAIRIQSEANEKLANQQLEAAKTIQSQTEAVFTALKTEFPVIVRDSFEQVRRDAAAIMAARAGGAVAGGAPPGLRSKGGPIYASRGSLIKEGFVPRGNDTVPAINVDSGQKYMLEEGEFVINERASNKYYDLLKAINRGDNIDGMYARDGGVIYDTRKKRREEYEQRKAEARARFREQKPGLARVLDAKADREPRYKRKGIETPEMKKALDEAESRGGKTKTQKRYEMDRGQKLFGEFLASTDGYDDSYSNLSSDIIFKDLRATGESPLGYSSLSLEDRNLANMAIDRFISAYEFGRTKAANAELEKVREARAAEAPKLAAAREAEAREAYSSGLLSLEELGVEVKEKEPDFKTARPLTAEETAKLRQKKLDKQFAESRARSQPEREKAARLIEELEQQRAESEARQRLDYAAGFETNPYTGKRYSDNNEKKLAQERAREEGKTLDQVAQERAARIARTTTMANKAKADRLAREAYAKEQAEYEERMKVAAEKAREQRRYDKIRFETAEKNKGYLGYFAEGLYEATPTRAIGEAAYGLGEVAVGGFTGGVAGLASLATVIGAAGVRAAQYEGDLLEQGGLQPRTKLEEDQLAQGLLAATESNLAAAGAGFSTAGTGFERIGRAFTFDKDTMEAQRDSALATYEAQKAQELSNQSPLEIPLGGDGRTNYSFRLPSQREIFGASITARDEALGALVPTPGIPGAGRLAAGAGKRVSRGVDLLDAGVKKMTKKPPTVSLPQPIAGKFSPEQQLTNIAREEATSSATRAARTAQEAAIDARTGTVRVRNKTTGEIERIPKKAASNPDEYFAARQVADERTFGKKFELDTMISERKAAESAAAEARKIREANIAAQDRRIAEILSEGDAEAALPTPSVRDLADPERVRRVDEAVRRGRKFEARARLRGVERPEFSSVPATPEVSVPKPTTSTKSRQVPKVSEKPSILDRLGLKRKKKKTPEQALEDYKTKQKEQQLAAKYGEKPSRIEIVDQVNPTPLARTSSARPVSSADQAAVATAVAPKPAATAPKPAATKPVSVVEAAPTPAATSTPQVLSEADQIAKLDSEIALLRSQEKKGIFGFGKVSKQDEIERLVTKKQSIQRAIVRRENIAKATKALEIERQGPGVSFYEGEEWKRLVEGGIPNEFRTYGTASRNFSEEAQAFGRLRSAQQQSRGFGATIESNYSDLGAEIMFDPKTGAPLPKNRAFETFLNEARTKTRYDTSFVKDPVGGIRILGKDTTGRPGAILYNIPADAMTPELLENLNKLNIPEFVDIPGLNSGGMIRGKPGIDQIPAFLTDKEYVVRAPYAQQNLSALNYMNKGGIIKPKYMYDGGQVSSTSTSTPSTSSASSFGGSYTISLEDRSKTFMETFVTQLNTFGTDFDSYITRLAQIKIPDKIEMSGRHTVEVNITGAAAFDAIEDGVRSLINTEIGKKMNLLWNQSNGQLGESIPTGDVGARRGSGAQA